MARLQNSVCPAGFYNIFNYTREEVDLLLTCKYFISGWLSLFVILVGILANSITICALLHRYLRKSSTNAYLLALTSCNLMSLLCLFLMLGLRFTLVHPYASVYCFHWYENFINQAIPYITPINHFFQLSGIYLTVAVSIDRYILIKKQIRSTETNRRRRRQITWFVIMTIFLFCFLFTLPNWFLYKSNLVEVNLSRVNPWSPSPAVDPTSSETKTSNATAQTSLQQLQKITHFRTEFTDFGRNSVVRAVLNVYLYIPFVFGLPISILLVVNILIIYELVQITARKRLLGTISTIDRNITIMLVMVVVVFLVCQVPLTISHVLIKYKAEILYEKKFFIYNSFTNFLICINLSANFALYCFFGQHFRDTIKFMLCSKDLPQSHRRISSLFYNTDSSRRASSIFYSMYSSMASMKRNSSLSSGARRQNSLSPRSSKSFGGKRNNRKSLPIIKRAATFDVIEENGNSANILETRLGSTYTDHSSNGKSHEIDQRELIDQMKQRLMKSSHLDVANGNRKLGPRISFNESLLPDKKANGK